MISPIIAVKDLNASLAFYTQKLGFKHDFSMPDEAGVDNFAWVSLDTTTGMGLQLDPTLDGRGKGVVFMVYPPDEMNIDDYYAEVQQKGVTIVEPIKDEYWGDRCFTVHDPDGYVIVVSRVVKTVNMEEAMAAHREASGA